MCGLCFIVFYVIALTHMGVLIAIKDIIKLIYMYDFCIILWKSSSKSKNVCVYIHFNEQFCKLNILREVQRRVMQNPALYTTEQ